MRSDGLLFVTVFSCLFLALGAVRFPDIPKNLFGYVGPEVHETKVLFVGDIMLGRYVETLYDEQGGEYLFAGLSPLLPRYDAIVGNFEAAIPEQHSKTKEGEMRFSVRRDIATSLQTWLTAASLANNHAYDFDAEGNRATAAYLKSVGITPFGDARYPGSGDVYYLTHHDEQIAIIGINAVGGYDTSAITNVISNVAASSSMQIVFIHWGDEYVETHNESQEVLAKAMIDAGADAIIGHHPHVVQDVGWYNNVPIFYSLGNFIFDQYFSEAVQTHLAVELSIRNDEVTYRLIPMTSLNQKSVPRLMNIKERAAFLDVLAAKSHPAIANSIAKHGSINTTSVLAELKNKLMMSQ